MTDQMMITQPSSLFEPHDKGVSFWKYAGNYTYHPKIYLFYNSDDQPIGAIVGSGNISWSGLVQGVEAAVYISDNKELAELAGWFEEMLSKNSSAITKQDLSVWQERWLAVKKTEFSIIRTKKKSQRTSTRKRKSKVTAKPTESDTEIVEDLLFMPADPIAILGFDHARNNVRNLNHALNVLKEPNLIEGKVRSELKLLGMIDANQNLTSMGQEAQKARSLQDLAYCWCRWVYESDDKTIIAINPVILSFKNAAVRFWKMQKDVQEFFLERYSKDRKEMLQTIELLCNTSDLACELSLDDIEELQPLILNTSYWANIGFPQIAEYVGNKGTRSWDSNDRVTMMTAWDKVQ
jgi:NgoFVII-like restriction endonuclease